MSIRKLIAMTTLAAGLSGTAAVGSNLMTVIGSTSTAGAPSVCIKKALCNQQPAPLMAGRSASDVPAGLGG